MYTFIQRLTTPLLSEQNGFTSIDTSVILYQNILNKSYESCNKEHFTSFIKQVPKKHRCFTFYVE